MGIRDRVTYVDLLKRALADAKTSNFDVSEWHRFVYEAKQLHPKLFDRVYFSAGEGDRLYSEQADHAFHVLAQARLASVGNPVFQVLALTVDQKKGIRQAKADLMEQYASEIRDLANLADSVLVSSE